MFRRINKISIPIRKSPQYLSRSFCQSLKKDKEILFSEICLLSHKYCIIAVPLSFFVFLATPISYNNKISHEEYLVFTITKSIMIGFLFPISFPIISYNVLKMMNEK